MKAHIPSTQVGVKGALERLEHLVSALGRHVNPLVRASRDQSRLKNM